MIHLVFNRPEMKIKFFGLEGLDEIDASGDAWGNHGVSDDDSPPVPPYGHACWMPPGHYKLTGFQSNGYDCRSEGLYQIDVNDVTLDDLEALQKAGLATRDIGLAWTIGGIKLSVFQLKQYLREAIMIHGGGSNLGRFAFAPQQQLLRTFGCTRIHNADLATLVEALKDKFTNEHIIYSAVGDPKVIAG